MNSSLRSSLKSSTHSNDSGPPPSRGFNHNGMNRNSMQSVRHVVTFSERKFDTKTLPDDMYRVFNHLKADFGEEYGLLFVFTMRTAIELHRAWHMTLLTSKILQQIKDQFNLRMTWNLGVVRLKFRVEDGGYELHRKVPYDYDSEFQDLYMKIAVALVEGRISVHDALIFQTETKLGKHTARSGLFLRDFPGRLILYPLEASTCAVIFFGGDWEDAYVASICGFAAGLTEYALSSIGGEATVIIDVMVGIITGTIGGLFYRFNGESVCLSSVFLGTLYWFFYGTAFVIGLLEIIAGELETGVTRFIAVSVKTFVLCLGASFGMLISMDQAGQKWLDQEENCGNIDLSAMWWRIPLYLLCSASALGQYRTPIIVYWRGLLVQLAAYEVQWQTSLYLSKVLSADNLDTAASNVLGAGAAVITACTLSYFVDLCKSFYYARLLQRGQKYDTPLGRFMYSTMACTIRASSLCRIGRESEAARFALEEKLKQQTDELRDKGHPRSEVVLNREEENLLVECIVSAESLNIWAILMPALYQLVPGSMIAKLWFNSIFPPPLIQEDRDIAGTSTLEGGPFQYSVFEIDSAKDNIFSNLMVISTSLALGLILGFAVVQTFAWFWAMTPFAPKKSAAALERERERQNGMFLAEDNDPKSLREEEVEALEAINEEDEFAEDEAGDTEQAKTTSDDDEAPSGQNGFMNVNAVNGDSKNSLVTVNV